MDPAVSLTLLASTRPDTRTLQPGRREPRPPMTSFRPTATLRFASAFLLMHAVFGTAVAAQQRPAQPEPRSWTALEDHRQMMEQLGIISLRPGPSGNEQEPNHANYDESKANPFPVLPALLTMKDGRAVKTPAQWRARRAEIVEAFEREVYGRIPTPVPTVRWTLTTTDTGTIAGQRVLGRQLTGHVDNAGYPEISVDISWRSCCRRARRDRSR
jgi:(4-O-methyl)-D-glucuronate---lignin esterase